MLSPEDLTGALVEEIRKKHKLSVGDLYEKIGFEGRSYARLNNIRVKDSWKPGDRERVAAVLNELEGGDTDLSNYGSPAQPSFAEPTEEADRAAGPSAAETDVSPGRPLPGYSPADVARNWWDEAGGFHGPGVSSRSEAVPDHEWRCPQCDVDRSTAPCPSCGSSQPPKFVRIEPMPKREVGAGEPETAAEFDALFGTGEPVEATVDLARDETPVVAVSDPEDDDPDAYLALAVPAALGLTEAAARDGAYLITNGQLRTWDRCRRKWWLSWYRRLAVAREPVLGVRSTGTRVHRALEAYYVPAGTTPTDPREALERVLVDDWTEVARRAAERGVDEAQLAELSKKFQDSAALERAMVEGYVQWVAETGADADLKIVAPEATLTSDLDVSGQLVRLAALLDVRVERTTDGVQLFVDHKTVGDLKTPQVVLPQDAQMLHYMLLEYLCAIEEEVLARASSQPRNRADDVLRAQPAAAVALSLLRKDDRASGLRDPGLDRSSPGRQSDEQRSEQLSSVPLGMPQFPPQQGTQASAAYGGASAQDRRGESTPGSGDAQAFGGDETEDLRVAEEEVCRAAYSRMSAGALYNMLRRVKRTAAANPPFYDRVEVRHNMLELTNYLRHLVTTTSEILRARAALDDDADHHDVVPPNPTKNCSWDCDFQPICVMFDDGSRVEDAVAALYRTVDPHERYDRDLEKGTEGR